MCAFATSAWKSLHKQTFLCLFILQHNKTKTNQGQPSAACMMVSDFTLLINALENVTNEDI